MNPEIANMSSREESNGTELTPPAEALPDEQFIAAWNTVVKEYGGWPSADADELKMLKQGLYLTADVRKSEPRVSATLRLVQLQPNSYQLYLNDCTWGDYGKKVTEDDYRVAVDFVATIASRLCQIGIPIERIGFQGSYNDSARYESDMNARFGELKDKLVSSTEVKEG